MKKILFLLLVFGFYISCESSDESEYNEYNPVMKSNFYDGWEVIWEDNFNDSINTNDWSKIPRGKAEWNKHMTNDERCFEIKNGTVILKGIKNNLVPSDPMPYLTGGIYTKGKRTIKYGMIEIRAKFNRVQGAWPAIWLLSNERKWPDGGEIDIVETANLDDIIHQSVHSYYTIYSGKTEPTKTLGTPVIDKTKFNIYGAIIKKDSIIFTINGVNTFVYPKIDGDQQFPFGDEKYLLLDMQIGGGSGGNIINDLHLPSEMTIDWVRFYQRNEDKLDSN